MRDITLTETDGHEARSNQEYAKISLGHRVSVVAQRKVFTTPLLSEAKSDRNTNQFTKKKSRCQRGGVRGLANQNATTERTNLQTKRCSKDEAAALRKNHVM